MVVENVDQLMTATKLWGVEDCSGRKHSGFWSNFKGAANKKLYFLSGQFSERFSGRFQAFCWSVSYPTSHK